MILKKWLFRQHFHFPVFTSMVTQLFAACALSFGLLTGLWNFRAGHHGGVLSDRTLWKRLAILVVLVGVRVFQVGDHSLDFALKRFFDARVFFAGSGLRVISGRALLSGIYLLVIVVRIIVMLVLILVVIVVVVSIVIVATMATLPRRRSDHDVATTT